MTGPLESPWVAILCRDCQPQRQPAEPIANWIAGVATLLVECGEDHMVHCEQSVVGQLHVCEVAILTHVLVMPSPYVEVEHEFSPDAGVGVRRVAVELAGPKPLGPFHWVVFGLRRPRRVR